MNLPELECLKSWKNKLSRESNGCLDLLAHSRDVTFVWSVSDRCVLAINLGNRGIKGETILLKPSNNISFDVEYVVPNDTCTNICLWASDGIAVMKLPQTYEDKEITCMVGLYHKLILAKEFKIRSIKWHPGSETDSHIVVLTSDGILRCYNVVSDTLWTCPLYNTDKLIIQNRLPDWSSLRMIAVDFDFLSPQDQQNPINAEWLILVLYGNGDVYIFETKMKENKYYSSGPLRMYPPLRGNYGLDASSLLIMKLSPPVVIISTCTNTLYHTILMTDKTPDKKALYIFESIDLDIGMNSLDEDSVINSPIHLKIDSIEKSRYYCIHIGGVQLVTVPFISKITEYWENGMNEFQLNESSSIQNLMCSAIVKKSVFKSIPIIGCAFIDVFMSVLVLQCDGNLVQIKPFKLSNIQSSSYTENITQTENEEFFLAVGTRARKSRTLKPPLLKFTKNTSPQDCSMLVSKAKKTLSSCIKAHNNIAITLNQKSETIKVCLQGEIKKLENLKNKKAQLKENAEAISNKYKELCDTQYSLFTKIDALLRQMHSDNSFLSQNEIETLKKLKTVQKNLERYDEKIKILKSSYEYQGNVGGIKENLFRSKTAFLNNVRVNTIRASLTALTEEMTNTSASIEGQAKLFSEINFI